MTGKFEELSDRELMQKYADEGDLEAFEVLVERHEKPLYNFILRSVGREVLAEEILQETFVAVVRGASDWEPTAKVSTWLYSIARYRCIDALRKKSPSLTVDEPVGEDGPTRAETLVDEDADDQDAETDRKRLGRLLMESVEKLPSEQREVFMLRQVSEMKYQEIAEVTGASVGTVKSRLRLAMKKLRRGLKTFPEVRELMEVRA